MLTEIQDERTWTVTELIGGDALVGVPVTDYDEARAATDQAIAAFRDTVAGSAARRSRRLRPALDDLSQLEDVRASVESNTQHRAASTRSRSRTRSSPATAS